MGMVTAEEEKRNMRIVHSAFDSHCLFCLLPVNILMNNVGFGNQLLLNSCVIQPYLEFTKEINKISTVNHAV